MKLLFGLMIVSSIFCWNSILGQNQDAALQQLQMDAAINDYPPTPQPDELFPISIDKKNAVLVIASVIPNLQIFTSIPGGINSIKNINQSEWSVFLKPDTHRITLKANGFADFTFPLKNFKPGKTYYARVTIGGNHQGYSFIRFRTKPDSYSIQINNKWLIYKTPLICKVKRNTNTIIKIKHPYYLCMIHDTTLVPDSHLHDIQFQFSKPVGYLELIYAGTDSANLKTFIRKEGATQFELLENAFQKTTLDSGIYRLRVNNGTKDIFEKRVEISPCVTSSYTIDSPQKNGKNVKKSPKIALRVWKDTNEKLFDDNELKKIFGYVEQYFQDEEIGLILPEDQSQLFFDAYKRGDSLLTLKKDKRADYLLDIKAGTLIEDAIKDSSMICLILQLTDLKKKTEQDAIERVNSKFKSYYPDSIKSGLEKLRPLIKDDSIFAKLFNWCKAHKCWCLAGGGVVVAGTIIQIIVPSDDDHKKLPPPPQFPHNPYKEK